MSNSCLILDDAHRYGLNTYNVPDMGMRKANGCRLRKGYLANLVQNIRENRNKISVNDGTAKVCYIKPGSYSPSEIVSAVNTAFGNALDAATENVATTINLTLEADGSGTDMYRFKHGTDGVAFTITFQSTTLARLLGFSKLSYTSELGSYAKQIPLADRPKHFVYPEDAIDDTIDKAVIFTCNRVLAENTVLCTGYNTDGTTYPIIKDQYFCTFLIDGGNVHISRLDEPITHTNIFKSGGCAFSLWYATGEPVDLNGGYIILEFEFL